MDNSLFHVISYIFGIFPIFIPLHHLQKRIESNQNLLYVLEDVQGIIDENSGSVKDILPLFSQTVYKVLLRFARHEIS